MSRVFVMYRLKEDVAVDDYVRWSLERDQPTTSGQEAVHRFTVYLIKGASNAGVPFTVIECIDVESWEAWQKTLDKPVMQHMAKEWDKYGDHSSLVMIHGERID